MAFDVETQEMDQWCWAAVAVSVDRYFDLSSPWIQCRIAEEVLNSNQCCANKPAFNRPASLESALNVTGRLKARVGPLQFDEIRDEITAKMPVCVWIKWQNGGGHFVVISGYKKKLGRQLVIVRDPLYPDSTMDYDDFKSAYQGMGQWGASYLLRA